METIDFYHKVREKFFNKGYIYEFHILVPPPPFVWFSPVDKEKIIKSVYLEEWEYWNIWIDYQQYK